MPNPGDKVKHYKILSPLGKGGMGEVYLAQDTVLDRRVAIKFLPEEMEEDAKAQERFVREAKAAAALDHPFICKIYETGELEGKAYIVMEYIEGQDLKAKLDEGPLPFRDSLRVALETAEALEKAHENGIVHRDLKPANIMLTPQGHVKVMDFGLAKRVLPVGDSLTQTITQASITEQGTIMGTLAYMSPEQARGGEVDGRSDIFSLGVIIQEMVTGNHPFSRPSPIETLSAVLRDAPPSVRIKPRKVISPLSSILRKALAKDPKDRYQNIADLVGGIRKVQREITLGTRLIHRGWPVIAATVIIIAMLLTGILWLTRRPPVSPQESGLETISVLISDFQNQTGDSVFDGVLEKALGISLEGASFISIHNRQQALRLAAELDPRAAETLNEELAQLVSRSAGINVVVAGSIEPSEKGFTIKVRALDTVKSEKIYEDSITIGTKSEILKAADRFAAELRSDLGDISADSIQALTKETFTTTSLEAMKAFARGQELDDLGSQEEALKEYLRAIDHDPNFGRAYASLAMMYYNLGKFKEAKDYFQKAMKLIDTMTDREKYRTRGIYYLMERDFKKAIDEYSTLLEQFPGDYVAHANLGLAYFFARNMPKAVEEGRLDVRYNPQGVHAHYNLSWYALAAGDLQTAEEEARTALKLNPNFRRAYVCLALTQLAKGNPTKAAETYRRLEAMSTFGASLAATGLADLAIYEGRLTEAINILERGIAFDLENGEIYNAADKYIMLAQTHLLQGKKELAVEAADRAVATSREVELLFSAAQVCLDAGQEDKARALAGELSKKHQPEPLAYAKLIGGELSRVRSDIGNAVNLFHESKSQIDTWLGHFFLGRAYLQAEDYTAANSEFESCLKRGGEVASIFLNDLSTYRYLPPVYYYLGRTQEGLGSDAASDSYQKFLKIKEKDDGGDPMVEDARRRLADL